MQGATPRNDLCRLFVAEGMLDPLSNALLAVCADNDDLAESAKAKLVHIFLLVAQSDRKVKVAMASRTVVRRASLPAMDATDTCAGLVKSLGMLDTELAAPVLKSLKHLTMAPETLDTLQHANVIEVLVHILSEQAQTKLAAVSPCDHAARADLPGNRHCSVQPVSTVQVPAGGNCQCRRDSDPAPARRGQLAAQAVCPADPARLCREQDLSPSPLAARRPLLLPRPPLGSVLVHVRPRGAPRLVRPSR